MNFPTSKIPLSDVQAAHDTSLISRAGSVRYRAHAAFDMSPPV